MNETNETKQIVKVTYIPVPIYHYHFDQVQHVTFVSRNLFTVQIARECTFKEIFVTRTSLIIAQCSEAAPSNVLQSLKSWTSACHVY